MYYNRISAHLVLFKLTSTNKGGGTGPADVAAAGPIIYSKIARTKNYHKNIF